ncbi:MAG TPA: hypothetical protein PLQ67_03950, partial [Burkholderiaceae bacterium]|nr:hypothetical protein [Burkholderiaceae bacterium]
MPLMPVNDLQLVLLAIAAALLLALFAWSKWQERQALKQFEQSLHEGVSDALLGEAEPVAKRPLQEPSFGQGLASQFRSGRQEPTLTQAPAQPLEVSDEPLVAKTVVAEGGRGCDRPDEPDAEPSSLGQAQWVEDPLLDSVIELRCAHPVDGVGVFDAMATLGQAQLPLPVNVVAWEGRAESWVPPDRFGFYSELLVAIQL